MLRATLNDGRTFTVAPKHGATYDDMVTKLVADSFTGSAAILADAVLEDADGTATFRFDDVRQWSEDV